MKIKKKRRVAVRIDMTPMVDIGFLLLIFYMATTQFKPPEKKQVNLPSSHSMIELPKRNVFMITVPPVDSVFIDYVTKVPKTLEDGSVVEETSRRISAIPFEMVESTGDSVQHLREEAVRSVDRLYPREDQSDTRRRAKEDVLASLVVVKGDKDVDFGVMEKVMNSLKDNGITSFQIITELEQE